MAKGKRKVSASQRAKENIETAKYLKKIGVISAKANLHSGRYISRGVLKKVRELEYIAQNKYKAVKVPSKTFREIQQQGYITVNRRVVVPDDRKFINRLKAGVISGITPVPGGMLQRVVLPVDIQDLPTFFEFVNSGKLNEYKLDSEEFAFAFHGHMSFRAFMNAEDFHQYFRRYESIERAYAPGHVSDLSSQYKALELYRLRAGDYAPPSMAQRRKEAQQRRAQRRKEAGDGRRPKAVNKNSTWYQNRKARDADRKREARAALKNDGAAYVGQLLKDRERKRKMREKAKNK